MDKDKIIELINTYWKFDNVQQQTSTWHDKQDLISAIEQLHIPVVSKSLTFEGEKCKKCTNFSVVKYKDGKECTACGNVC